MIVIRTNSKGCVETTLSCFLREANVFKTPSITRFEDGRLYISFNGVEKADSWSFFLEKDGLSEWLLKTGAQLYRVTCLPDQAQSISLAWPNAEIDSWNRRGFGKWQYSPVSISELFSMSKDALRSCCTWIAN